MSQTELNIILGIIFAIGAVWQLKNASPFISKLFNKIKSDTKIIGEKTSSDSQPPEGFVEHIKIIKSASHAATADVREMYYEKGLTFAETLQAEYERVTKTTKKTGAK